MLDFIILLSFLVPLGSYFGNAESLGGHLVWWYRQISKVCV